MEGRVVSPVRGITSGVVMFREGESNRRPSIPIGYSSRVVKGFWGDGRRDSREKGPSTEKIRK